MKVVHYQFGELSGGAAKGAYWLHRALVDLGIDSRFVISGRDDLGDSSVVALGKRSYTFIKLRFQYHLYNQIVRCYRNRRPEIFSLGWEGLALHRLPLFREGDVIHLHFINNMIRFTSLKKANKPIIWTLRDLWPMTGGCHYSYGCRGFEEACGNCPALGSHRKNDLSYWVRKNKNGKLPEKARLVGISRWVTEEASKSSLFSETPKSTISNNIDCQEFFPIDKTIARSVLGLSRETKVILVGATSFYSRYKGGDLLEETLSKVSSNDWQLVIFGKKSLVLHDLEKFSPRYLGELRDLLSLRTAYSAASLFLAPYRAEAFGKTIAESLACGTPAVIFDAGGQRDIVESGVSGFRANPYCTVSLAAGVDRILKADPMTYDEMCRQSRKRVLRNFDSRVIASRYIEAYKEILNESPVRRSMEGVQ